MSESTRPKVSYEGNSNIIAMPRPGSLPTIIGENGVESSIMPVQSTVKGTVARVLPFKKARKTPERKNKPTLKPRVENADLFPEVGQKIITIAGGVRNAINPASLVTNRAPYESKKRAKLEQVFGQMNLEAHYELEMTIEEAAKRLAGYIDKENEALFRSDLFSDYEKKVAHDVLWKEVAVTIIKTLGKKVFLAIEDRHVEGLVQEMIRGDITVARWQSILRNLDPAKR
ncbi:MAG TPA: hypothetical protein P5229_04695 [Candidatus Gracilibacteria bacterium]|nr:hypothetical protein [Candidatus Gracilibacteria bacterium]